MTEQVKTAAHAGEVASGERFGFGKNWQAFLSRLNDERIQESEQALKAMLGRDSLVGVRFLDAGSGSGLSSLAARRLGATVVSFDYDPASVACTRELKRRYFPDDAAWSIEEGSVLDPGYLAQLGRFDVVYSWGVLHHTGQMYQALGNVAERVVPGGALFLSIYNDQGGWSRRWKRIKRVYNRLPGFLKLPYTILVMGPRELRALAAHSIGLKPMAYVRSWTDYQKERGMSRWHDMTDWVGGYPFEVAKPEEVFDFYASRGFTLVKLKTCGGGLGCNEYVFRKGEDQGVATV